MKTIFLKVEVPDDFNEISDFSRIEIKEVSSGNVIYDDVKFTEIILPTEEDIIQIIDNHLMLNHDDTPYCGHNAAKLILNKMKGE